MEIEVYYLNPFEMKGRKKSDTGGIKENLNLIMNG